MNNSLIDSLKNPGIYDHAVTAFDVIETHISWILLTGQYAYKIKKPVNFGFVDFSSLASRRHYCYKEVELNSRLAPELYLGVVSIGGSSNAPLLNKGEPIEYAVKMCQFSQDALLSAVASRGELSLVHVEQIVRLLSKFHQQVNACDYDHPYGNPKRVVHWVNENFSHIRPLLSDPDDRERLKVINDWTINASCRLLSTMMMRKERGFIRECHGDLHLGNMALIDDKVTFFDCIEFNKELRWIDVINEAAFVAMDLEKSGYPRLSWHFFNRYLQETGDYSSIVLFRYYFVYRALVRAKVALLRTVTGHVSQEVTNAAWAEYRAYIDLAIDQIQRWQPLMILMHGLSGSGKSMVAERLAGLLGAVQLRSDLERKRMFHVAPRKASGSALYQGIYTKDASSAVYDRLASLCCDILSEGHPVIIDATFLKFSQREKFRKLAKTLSVPFEILSVSASVDRLKARLRVRAQGASDVSEADEKVLMAQLERQDPLRGEEFAAATVIDNDEAVSDEQFTELVADLCAKATTMVTNEEPSMIA